MASLEQWGTLADGTPVILATLSDDARFIVKVSSYGATLVDVRAPDRNGHGDSVLLGFDSLGRYLDPAIQAAWPYFGSTVGRYANRIGGARLMIDGIGHPLSANEGGHHLHGGVRGFDRRPWAAAPIEGAEGVRMTLVSPDGDEGFPGRLEVSAEFVVTAPGTLTIRYIATTDAPTHVNIASHGYFNLAGRAARSVEDHLLLVAADRYLPIDGEALPTGVLADVAKTPFDLRTPQPIGSVLAAPHEQIRAGAGLNHCFVLAPGIEAVRLDHLPTGRRLSLRTTAPGVQVYSANALDGRIADGAGRPFVRRQAVALEAQYFPDSPNRPSFPSTLLRPGETYRSETVLCFSADQCDDPLSQAPVSARASGRLVRN